MGAARGVAGAAPHEVDGVLRVELFAMLEPLFFRCKDLFHEIDRDRGGTVSADEMIAAFERKRVAAPAEKVRQLFSLIDANGDGQITISEFMDEMRNIKLARRFSVSERARRLRRTSSTRGQRRWQLNAQAAVKAKERTVRAPGQGQEHPDRIVDEDIKLSKVLCHKKAAWRAFEQNRADQLRRWRSARSSRGHAPARFIDVPMDSQLRGLRTTATWMTDLNRFTEQHCENFTLSQQQTFSALARDQPSSQAAEIWERSVCLRTKGKQLSRRPVSAPAAETVVGTRHVQVRASPSTSVASTADVEHHDHAETLVERGNWGLENEKEQPGVHIDTGGRTIWIGELPHTCVEAPRFLQAVLEKHFGAVVSLAVRKNSGRQKSWALVTLQDSQSAKNAAAAGSIDLPGV